MSNIVDENKLKKILATTPADQNIMISGRHGIGKSGIVSIVVHELCHAVWNMIASKGVDLEAELSPLMRQWMADENAHGSNATFSYASSCVYEFWAEMLTQCLCGEDDSHPKAVFEVAHKYQHR